MEKLPEYSSDMPITITHSPDSTQHILEKTVTLNVGKSRSFSFTDDYGDNVQCHINNITLIDVWKNTEEELRDPKLAERFSPEQLEEARKHSYEALEQCCPKGMCPFSYDALKTRSANRNARPAAERLCDTDASVPGHLLNPCGTIPVS